MKKSKECRHIVPLLGNAANETAHAKEMAAVTSHIETCTECRAEYENCQQTAQLIRNWRQAEIPESRRDWRDLHARLTAPKPQKLRPVFPLGLGIGGAVGAVAIAICLLLPHSVEEGEKGRKGERENVVAVQNVPTDLRVRSTARRNAPSGGIYSAGLIQGTKTYPAQKQTSYGRKLTMDSPLKMRSDMPALTLAKSQEPSFLSQKKRVPPQMGGAGVILAQHKAEPKSEGSRRVLLNVDGETSTSDTAHEYALGAIPSGQSSNVQLTPASYSPSEMKAW